MTITRQHPTEAPPSAVTTIASRPCAVAWIDDVKAMVARMGTDHRISTCSIERGGEAELTYLAIVVRAIGDRERVVILGPGSDRLALEREYVSVYRRPDRLVDVEPTGEVDEAELVERLRELAG